jgi:hypothetical protein
MRLPLLDHASPAIHEDHYSRITTHIPKKHSTEAHILKYGARSFISRKFSSDDGM